MSEIIDATKLSLTEWLKKIFIDDKDFLIIDYSFPTDKIKEEYLSIINTFSECELKKLIRMFLIHSGGLTFDEDQVEYRLKFRQDLDLEFDRRHLLTGNAWEGITWILDLLPHYPLKAIETLSHFLTAHCQLLPDGRYDGILDVMSMIRAKYISNPKTIKDGIVALLNLKPREFEILISKLYESLKYKVKLTQASKDGGIDVFCEKNIIGKQEKIIVQCKRYKKNVGVPCIRELNGVKGTVNKAVVVAPIGFTKSAIDFSKENNIELIAGKNLITLLNSNLGALWAVNIDRYILENDKNLKQGEKQNG